MSRPAIRDQRSAGFFDELGAGQLLLRCCIPHGHLSAPDVMSCADCGTSELVWTAAKGNGEVVSWTAIHSRPDEAGQTSVTAFAGVVELVEGVWVLARLVQVDGAPSIGDPVILTVLATDGEPVYAFRPTEGA